MSEIIVSSEGRFRRVTDGKTKWFLWECPRCRQWSPLSEAQWEGREIVECGDGKRYCGYRETHRFGVSLLAAIQANILTGKPSSSED